MPRTRTQIPLSAFDPRYKALLLKGSRERFDIELPSREQAVALRHRLHTYRSQAKRHFGDRATHEWEPLYGCFLQVSRAITDPSEPERWRLRFLPRAQEFGSVLDTVPLPDAPQHVADDMLDRILSEGKKP